MNNNKKYGIEPAMLNLKFDGLGHITYNTLGITLKTSSSVNSNTLIIIDENSETGIICKINKELKK